MCLGQFEFKSPIYKKFMKKNKCLNANDKLENGFMCLYQAFQFNVIMPPLHIQNINHKLNMALLNGESPILVY